VAVINLSTEKNGLKPLLAKDKRGV
jgi:hypothetical protein